MMERLSMGKKFVTFDVIGDNGETLVVGLREVGGVMQKLNFKDLKKLLQMFGNKRRVDLGRRAPKRSLAQ